MRFITRPRTGNDRQTTPVGQNRNRTELHPNHGEICDRIRNRVRVQEDVVDTYTVGKGSAFVGGPEFGFTPAYSWACT